MTTWQRKSHKVLEGSGREIPEPVGACFHLTVAQGWVFCCRCDGCEAVLLGIEQQVLRANQYKENHHRTQQQVEAEVTRNGAFVPLLRVA